jgi:hypothetical protein
METLVQIISLTVVCIMMLWIVNNDDFFHKKWKKNTQSFVVLCFAAFILIVAKLVKL